MANSDVGCVDRKDNGCAKVMVNSADCREVQDRLLKIGLHALLLRFPLKRDRFACELDKVMSAMHKLPDEDAKDLYCPQESAHIR